MQCKRQNSKCSTLICRCLQMPCGAAALPRSPFPPPPTQDALRVGIWDLERSSSRHDRLLCRGIVYLYPSCSPVKFTVASACVQCTAGDNDDCVDQLSFETLISTALLSRYMSLLKQYHRLVVCGPNGTGKTYLALALAHSLASRCSPSRSYIDVAARCCYIHILDSLYFLKKFHVAAFTLNKVAFWLLVVHK